MFKVVFSRYALALAVLLSFSPQLAAQQKQKPAQTPKPAAKPAAPKPKPAAKPATPAPEPKPAPVKTYDSYYLVTSDLDIRVEVNEKESYTVRSFEPPVKIGLDKGYHTIRIIPLDGGTDGYTIKTDYGSMRYGETDLPIDLGKKRSEKARIEAIIKEKRDRVEALYPTVKDPVAGDFVLVKGGTFEMGSLYGEEDEKPVRKLAVKDFYMSKYEVTVAQFKAFIEDTGYNTEAERRGQGICWAPYVNGYRNDRKPVNWRHDSEGNRRSQDEYNYPVIFVSVNDAMAYCEWLSRKTGLPYRLPTEAEWEYAAGNGERHTKFSWGNNDPEDKLSGNVNDETGKGKFSDRIFEAYHDGYIFAAPVGSYLPNDLGIYDLTGNVKEICSDGYQYKNSVIGNSIRGGSFGSEPGDSRNTNRAYIVEIDYPLSHWDYDRYNYNYDLGFRVVRTSDEVIKADIAAEEKRKAEEARKVEDMWKAYEQQVAVKSQIIDHPIVDTLIFIKGGSFNMGCIGKKSDCKYAHGEIPVHSVTLSDFYMGQTEVTLAQWKSVMGYDPYPKVYKSDNQPVCNVSWEDVQIFLSKLNSLSESVRYRLPTEAEWEYAARGGQYSLGYIYSGSNDLNDVATYSHNPGVFGVKRKKPNELGLYDMSGNASEWCSDWYDQDYYKKSPAINPSGPVTGTERVMRGGDWLANKEQCRVTYRGRCTPACRTFDIGFRLVMTPKN